MPVLLPTTIDEAVSAMASGAPADPPQILAGGTDFMVEVNAGHRRPGTVVSLSRVAELRQWQRADGGIRLGAAVTYTRLLQPELARLLPALAQAARTVGSPQIRNAGTIGGNLATASPAGDTLPVLSALEAVVEVSGPDGTRDIPVGAFITGPKRTSLGPGEIIVAVRVPILRGHQEFRKVGVRNAMVIAVASVALVVDADTRTIRCALGSVGPVPLRAVEAEAWLGGRLDWEALRVTEPGDVDQFGAMVAEAARPIDDHRGTSAYRRRAVAVLAKRAAAQAFASGAPS